MLQDSRRLLHLSESEREAFVTLLGNAVVFAVLMHGKGMSYRELFHPSPHSMRSTAALVVPPVVLLVPFLLLAVTEVAELLVQLAPMSRWEEQMFERLAADNVATLVSVCVLAPVLEEMLFRGIILRSFLHQYPRWAAITGSAILFGIAHLNIYQFVVALALGTVAGWLYERTRSLIPCIALHAIYNTGVMLTAAMARGARAEPSHDPLEWALAAAAGCVGVAVLRRMLRAPAERAR